MRQSSISVLHAVKILRSTSGQTQIVNAAVSQAVQTAATSAQHANAVARDVAGSKSVKEAGTKLWVVLRQMDSSAWFAKVARAMVGDVPSADVAINSIKVSAHRHAAQ